MKNTVVQITEMRTEGEHERVLLGVDAEAGYRGIIAIHNTVLGPAVGGTRFWNYASDEEALTDALRLSRGMTYKNALAGLPFGGGKSIIVGDNRTTRRETIFRAHGRFIESLGGRYITAVDVGTSTSDLSFVHAETEHVACLDARTGDPSPLTARGVFRAIQASARVRWGADDLSGKRVAVQGCGHVGYHLAKELHAAGARLIVADTDVERVRRVGDECEADAVSPGEIYGVEADIFAPCALGGIINDQTIPQLKVEIVAGGANNQLLESLHGDALEQRGILYAPDYVANAGGVIYGCVELLGWEPARSFRQVDEIYETVLKVFKTAKAEGLPAYRAADLLAEQRLRVARGVVEGGASLQAGETV